MPDRQSREITPSLIKSSQPISQVINYVINSPADRNRIPSPDLILVNVIQFYLSSSIIIMPAHCTMAA